METKVCKLCNIEKETINFRIINKKYYCSYCRECERKKSHKYRIDNLEKRKKYYENNKNVFNERKRKYYKEHKEKETKRIKEYKLKNQQKVREYRKKYDNIEINKVKSKIRGSIRFSFKRKGINKSLKTEKIIGISFNDFYKYLLQTYKNNYGYDWNGIDLVHIDHIIPLAIAKTEEDVIKLCYYKNLQLLKAKDNLEKSYKTNWELTK